MRVAPRTTALAAALSALTVASLAVLGWGWWSGSTVTAAGPGATVDGVAVDVRQTNWAPLDHVMDDAGGFLMPSQMMPGAPTGGQVRLGVTVTLRNTTSGTRELRLVEDFALVAGPDSEPVPLAADTIGGIGRIGPGTALNGILYFDVPVPADGELPPLYLRWTRGDDTVLIPVPVPGEAPTHVH
ncbi:MAG TPA: hypothetical protein VKY81_04460 [Natronosporangium sp.]|nr:hypothetical protein [Natronosporangium sp.]